MNSPEKKRPNIFDRIMHLPLLRILEPFYKKHKEGLLYLFFGGVTTLVSFFVFWLFDAVIGLDPLLANLISWVTAVADGLILVKLEQAIFLSLQKAKGERLLESLNIAVTFK